MKFRSDIFLAQGYSHYVCEDYILYGNRPEGPYVILADGCSSAPNTDIGARLICLAAQKYMQALHGKLNRKDMVQKVMNRALLSCESLGIESSCLHATLLVMHVEDNLVHVNGWGDGHAIITWQDGTSRDYSVSFQNEMPWYPLYHVTPHLMARYALLTDGKNPILSPDLLIHIKTGLDGEYYRYETVDGLCLCFAEMEAVRSISIASDGLGSFLNVDAKADGPMDPKGIAKELLAFKNTNGEFLKRRAGKTIKRYKMNTEGDRYDHYDDLSIGTILVEPDE